MSSRVQLYGNHSKRGEKPPFISTWWMQIQHKCRISITTSSTGLSSAHVGVKFSDCKRKTKTTFSNHDAHKRMAFISPKSDFLLMQSNHRRISFHLVLPCTAKYQVSTCPQVPRLYVNTPVCAKIGFNLNLKIFTASATYITKLLNSGPLSKVRAAWNEIIHSEEDY